MMLGERTSPSSGLRGAWAILPVGSCEAHGPHLPLDTDVRLSVEMACRAQRRFAPTPAVVLPALPYGVTEYAAEFSGTLSVPADVVIASVVAVLCAAAQQGAIGLAIANSHLEPAHVDALFAAVAQIRARVALPIAFPNVASKRYAARLGQEFASGGGHAGMYESSMILALRPDLVDEPARTRLAPNPVNLAAAMRGGARTFGECGGPDAFFGDPAGATIADGEVWLDELGRILVEAMRGA